MANYTTPETASFTAAITALPLTVAGTTYVTEKVYDGDATIDILEAGTLTNLVATDEETTVPAGEFVLSNGEFVRVESTTVLGAGEAYLYCSTTADKLTMEGEGPVGIAALRAADDEATYNLSGQKVVTGYQGIVIKGGQKVMVK